MVDIPGGQVTLADLFRVMSAMQLDVSKVATKLEVIDARNKNADQLHADHEQRIRTLEQFRWKILGLALAISIVVSLLIAWLPSHLR